jgi:hypothetical protein
MGVASRTGPTAEPGRALESTALPLWPIWVLGVVSVVVLAALLALDISPVWSIVVVTLIGAALLLFVERQSSPRRGEAVWAPRSLTTDLRRNLRLSRKARQAQREAEAAASHLEALHQSSRAMREAVKLLNERLDELTRAAMAAEEQHERRT